MNLKTYRAYTLAEALTAVKRDLGSGAAILHTRTFKRGGVMGLGRRTVVEVTASSTEDAAAAQGRTTQSMPRNRVQPKAGPRTTAADAAYARTGRQQKRPQPTESLDARKLDLLAAIEQHRNSTQRRTAWPHDDAQAKPDAISPPQPKQAPPSPAAEPPPSRAHDTKSISPAMVRANHAPPSPAELPNPVPATADQMTEPVSPVARRFILQDPARVQPARGVPKNRCEVIRMDAAVEVKPSEVDTARILSAVENSNRESAAVHDQMHTIREMVGQILRQQHDQDSADAKPAAKPLPGPLFDLKKELVEQELSDDLAEGLCRAIEAESRLAELDNRTRLRSEAHRHLAEMIPVSPSSILDRDRADRPLTVALIGPTGVGKTTTLAKLAATFKLRRNRRVGLVTCDTYRIAAVDQLRTYAEIIDVPLKVVLTPAEMTQGCHQFRDCDVILVDTAGRSQRDTNKLSELSSFIDAADPHEVHLVLSSTASQKVLLQEIESFARVRADRLILSKLDEAVAYGGLINVIQQVGKPLSFVTTGQEVPDHLEAARASRLADLVLGGDLWQGAELQAERTTAAPIPVGVGGDGAGGGA